jgi:Domain of unknown function (DUF6647)
LRVDRTDRNGDEDMQSLLTVIVTWLSRNLGLPAVYDHPRIEFVPAAQMDALRARIAGSVASAELGRESGRSVEAFYDDANRTIYLPQGWVGVAPEELSVLVHEMVHHLQNVGGVKYACAQAREKPAYQAQDKWLAQFDRNLTDAFELDPLTVLVRTHCLY